MIEAILLSGYKFGIIINSSKLNLLSLHIDLLYAKELFLSEMHFSDINIDIPYFFLKDILLFWLTCLAYFFPVLLLVHTFLGLQN